MGESVSSIVLSAMLHKTLLNCSMVCKLCNIIFQIGKLKKTNNNPCLNGCNGEVC